MRTAVPRLDGKQPAGPGGTAPRVAVGQEWPDRPVRRARGRRGPGPGGRPRRRGPAPGAPVGRRFPGRLFHRAAARRLRRRRGLRPVGAAPGGGLRPAGGGHAPDPVHRAVRLPRPRGPRLHRRGRAAGQSAPCPALHRRAVHARQRRHGAPLRGRALGPGQRGADRPPLQPDPDPGRTAAAAVPHARRRVAGRLPGAARQRGPGPPHGPAVSRPRRARPPDARLPGTPGPGMPDHRRHGLPRLLPDRAGLHQLGQEPWRAGGTGPGLGRGLAGGLQPGDHRPGSAALRPAVRALPQPRARVHARLRRGLLPGQPRTGHRIRQGKVRPRRRQPDRHLRHPGRQGRGARRGPRAGDALQRLRPALEDDPLQSGRPLVAGPHAGTRACLQGTVRHRRGNPRPRRPGAAPGGPDAQHRHARRRGADRAGQADRFLPPVLPAGQRIQRRVPVRQGRRRGRRPGQVRLPGPAQPDHST